MTDNFTKKTKTISKKHIIDHIQKKNRLNNKLIANIVQHLANIVHLFSFV